MTDTEQKSRPLDIIESLEIVAGFLNVVAQRVKLPENEVARFTGKWAHLGTMTLKQALDRADASLAAAKAIDTEPPPAHQAYALLWREERISSGPFVSEARKVMLRSMTSAEQRTALAWVTAKHPFPDPDRERYQ